jgi:predicted alpha-1,2-mannosidase
MIGTRRKEIMHIHLSKKHYITLLLLLLVASACMEQSPANSGPKDVETSTLTRYVNPLIGTAEGGSHFGFGGNSGDTFPGATYPMGMVQWSPDTPSNLTGGYYYPDTTIKGFSLTHFSGRGCHVYQDIPFLPYVGTVTASPAAHPTAFSSPFSHGNEIAHPGYYSVHLDKPNVDVELTVTPHTGYGQFTYPASPASTMLINAGGSVNGNTRSSVQIDSATREVTGSVTSTVGCGSSSYTLYFAAQFDRAFRSFGTWNPTTVSPGSSANTSPHTGAFVTFDTTQQQVIHVKVGISFVSIVNARLNNTIENGNADFSSQRSAADAAWNSRLKSIEVQGGTEDEKRIFYTALYHTFLHPNIFNDVNGEYLGFDGRIHMIAQGHAHYENIAGWDQYRSLIQLRALLAPAETSDIAQSLITDAEQGDGHLPRWEQVNVDSHGMNGDNGAMLIAQAYAFGANNFDTKGALLAMTTGQAKIREGLADYLRSGYVAAETSKNSTAITEEYSSDDFGISTFAQAIGDTKVASIYRQRSNNWQHVFNASSGFMQPRSKNGTWTPNFVPTSQNGFTEGDATQYNWLVPFNLRTLFDNMGGNARVVARLNSFFTQLNAGPNSQYAFMGNEPCFEAPWEYDFAGAPAQTQRVVRAIQTQLFHATPAGLPGNDDGGSMSAWYVFSALGLYPEIPGVGGFVIGSPLFTSITVHIAGGNTLSITAPAASDATPYVQHLLLNGQPTTKLWLAWNTVKQNTTLTYTLGNNATTWGSGRGDTPPSYPV